ncbi:hypothetical protein [Rossellomorea marisflavi]|uniref:hypothetical protein n=1 Tax=Rossellomorea marisflavi TaxID=189381 RepID=UPI00345A0AB0
MARNKNDQPEQTGEDHEILDREKEQTVDSIPLDDLNKDLQDEKKKHKSKDSSSSEEY